MYSLDSAPDAGDSPAVVEASLFEPTLDSRFEDVNKCADADAAAAAIVAIVIVAD